MCLAIQGSPEWHAARACRIKASVCAALEGKHPYMKPADVGPERSSGTTASCTWRNGGHDDCTRTKVHRAEDGVELGVQGLAVNHPALPQRNGS